MSKSIVRVAVGLLIMVIVIGGLAACGEMGEPDYASAMTESALVSMSDCDYATHAALYSPDAQAAFTEGEFNTGCTEIKSLIGDYVDKEFQKAEVESGYVVVEYKATFSNEPDGVTVTVYFQKIDDEPYIAGFWLSSPKLVEASGGE